MRSEFPAESKRLEFIPVTESMLTELVDIYNSNPDFMRLSYTKPVVTVEEVRKDYLENKSYPDSYSIGIREKGNPRLIGITQFILNNPRDNKPWLGLIMFHKEKQGFGYAKEFMDVLTQWYRKNGFQSLRLGVNEGNEKAFSFYEKYGFRCYDTVHTEKCGKIICMSLSLK